MVAAMTHIANNVYNLAEEKWGWVLEAIDDKITDESNFEEHDIYVTDEETEEGEEEAEEEENKPAHPLQKIYGYLQGYMSQLPVIGFNSAKYDLNLVKRSNAKALDMHLTALKRSFEIKKNNEYACISTDQLKYLDMKQYLAGWSSYAGFLKAYHVEEQKGFFPYEWFDDVSKLEEKKLPRTMRPTVTLREATSVKRSTNFVRKCGEKEIRQPLKNSLSGIMTWMWDLLSLL